MRLIDADEETKWANENLPDTHAGVITCFLRDCGTIDPIHAAGGCYCQECNYLLQDLSPRTYHTCMRFHLPQRVNLDDYCSYGKPKE